MASLAAARCLNHSAREAVCRCPACRRFFCGECVVLFESRLLCAACIAAQTQPQAAKAASGLGLWGYLLATGGLLIPWFFFYFIGWFLLQFRERVPLQ
jgi:hypothetical protein